MKRERLRSWLAGFAMLGVLIAVGVASASNVPRAHQAYRSQCRDPYPSRRDPSNPLMLPKPPGPNPLTGARFFVDGPAHGAAAKAIAELIGVNPASYPDDYSWARFKDELDHGSLHARLNGHPVASYAVQLLEKIAAQPEGQRFSLYSQGGGPGAIFSQVQKIFCHNLTADPGSIPIIDTFFLYQAGYCETTAQILANRPTFERQVNEMAAGIGNRPAVMLLELDAIGASLCMQQSGALPEWEADIRYEIDKVAALPHTVVYVEAGYSDGNSPSYTARALKAIGTRGIRGFFTNDTHINWTINEIRWGQRVSSLTGGLPFIVNTADSGRGPKLNPHPTAQGVEDLCNPPGRAAGPRTTAQTGFAHVDAFIWLHPPGNSSGSCNGGTASGTFWLHRALVEAGNADDKLGPGFPTKPY
jgi:endoglucanase